MKTKIYLVTNCYGDPNKIYIGKEKYPKRRKRLTDHQQNFGKNIIFTYIDEVNSLNSKDWKPLECFWIEYFRQLGFDLQNKNKGGGGSDFLDVNTRLKISKPILQYDLEGNFIREWPSITDAHFSLNLNGGHIGNCCKGKSKTSYGFIWRYKDNPLKENYKIPINKNSKQIYQYNLNGDLIKVWENALKICDYFNFKSPSNITNCCNGIRIKAYGYFWSYDKNKKFIIKPHKNSKNINQFTKEGKFIKKWQNIQEIQNALNIKSGTSISMCCRGKINTAYGYVWKH